MFTKIRAYSFLLKSVLLEIFKILKTFLSKAYIHTKAYKHKTSCLLKLSPKIKRGRRLKN